MKKLVPNVGFTFKKNGPDSGTDLRGTFLHDPSAPHSSTIFTFLLFYICLRCVVFRLVLSSCHAPTTD